MYLCVAEHEVPETIAHGAWVEKHGGICRPHSVKVQMALRHKIGDSRLVDFARNEHFVLSGACIDHCVGWLAMALIGKYDAGNVTVDFEHSYGIVERIDHRGNRQVLTVEQRIELFKNSHTDWEIFSDRLHLGA